VLIDKPPSSHLDAEGEKVLKIVENTVVGSNLPHITPSSGFTPSYFFRISEGYMV
jgi:hypothetical protein